ncbi:hypothetical protein, partial [Petrachloros mirabilis]
MPTWSFKENLVFWWVLFLAIQQMERYFLLPEVMVTEFPTTSVLAKTLFTGFRADLITASIAVLLVSGFAGIWRGLCWMRASFLRRTNQAVSGWRWSFVATGTVTGLFLIVLLLVDVGYYHFNQQRLNFVFFEYVGDLMTQLQENGLQGSQAAEQTGAEVHNSGKWAGMVLGFLLLEATAIALWGLLFARFVRPALSRFNQGLVPAPNVILLVGFV